MELLDVGEISGGPRRIRTPDPLIRSQVLYPAELSVHRAEIAGGGLGCKGNISKTSVVCFWQLNGKYAALRI